MKKFSEFRENVLSAFEMKLINGGEWNHSYMCDCGGTGFMGSGSLDDFRSLASSTCASGDPVSCTFDF
jgi:hypothetical protein